MLPQTRMIPVKTFRHTDPDAPVLQGVKGSLKTLLKACLVEGYGTQAPLGWEMPFEDVNRAAFRSKDETSNKHYLYVNHDIATHAARLRGAETMTSLDDLVGEFGGVFHATLTRDLTALAYSSNVTPWVLIGHEKAFILLMKSTYNSSCGTFLYFGDVPSFVPGDSFNTVLWRMSAAGAYPYFTNRIASNYIALGVCFARDDMAKSVDKPTQMRCSTVNLGANTANHIGTYSASTNQILASSTYLEEGAIFRGMLPGIFIPSVKLPVELVDCQFPGFEDYVQATIGEHDVNNASILVNKSAWVGV